MEATQIKDKNVEEKVDVEKVEEKVEEEEVEEGVDILDASESGDLDRVKYLLETKHIDVDSADSYGRTPLMRASMNGNLDLAAYLVKHGADVDKADLNGYTPLIRASMKGRRNVAAYLLEHGADIEKAAYEDTALIWASMNGDLDMVECLVEHNADVNKADGHGRTPLMMASAYGHLDVVEYLVKNKADMEKASNVGQTALMHASRNGHLNVAAYLLEQGANVEKANNRGRTALEVALENDKADVVRVLLLYFPPASIRTLARKYPTRVYKYMSELYKDPKTCHSTSLRNSHLLYEGEKQFYQSDHDPNVSQSDHDEHLYSHLDYARRRDASHHRMDNLYNNYPFFLRLRKMLASGLIPHVDTLKACLFVSMSVANPELFHIDSIIGEVVEAAWIQYGRGNHTVLSLLYLFYLGVTTLVNYTFHEWILIDDFKIVCFVLIAVIFIFSLFFMGLEFRELKRHFADNSLYHYASDGENYLDWVAYISVCVGCGIRVAQMSETNLSASLMAVGTALLWLKLTHFLCPFQSTGPLVRMMFFIMYKIKELLLILAIVILAFSQAEYLLSYKTKDLEFSEPLSGIMQSFVFMMGQINLSQLHETSNPKLAQFLLVGFILVSTILILNLLIALMNSAYTKIAANELAEWNRERAIIITEQWYFHTPNFAKYQFCICRVDDIKKRHEAKERRSVDLKEMKESEARIVKAGEEKMKETEARIVEACEKKMNETQAMIVKASEEVVKMKEVLEACERRVTRNRRPLSRRSRR